MPRQTCLPYQNNQDYQKLLNRHITNGQDAKQFDFPTRKGRELRSKTDSTGITLAKYASNPLNRSYGSRINNNRGRPDYSSGFKSSYLTGTQVAANARNKQSISMDEGGGGEIDENNSQL